MTKYDDDLNDKILNKEKELLSLRLERDKIISSANYSICILNYFNIDFCMGKYKESDKCQNDRKCSRQKAIFLKTKEIDKKSEEIEEMKKTQVRLLKNL